MDKTVGYTATDAARDIKSVSQGFTPDQWHDHDATTAQPFCTVGSRIDYVGVDGLRAFGCAADAVTWNTVKSYRLVGGWKRHHSVPVQPVDTFGQRVEIRTTDGRVFMQFADDDIQWGKVVAYRVVPPDEHIELTVAPLASIGALRVEDGLPVPEYTGGSVSYYSVQVKNPTTPGRFPYTAECNDIIEALGLNYAEGNAFKAIWRRAAARNGLMKKGYTDGLYDAEKIEFFGGRLVAQEKAK